MLTEPKVFFSLSLSLYVFNKSIKLKNDDSSSYGKRTYIPWVVALSGYNIDELLRWSVANLAAVDALSTLQR